MDFEILEYIKFIFEIQLRFISLAPLGLKWMKKLCTWQMNINIKGSLLASAEFILRKEAFFYISNMYEFRFISYHYARVGF